MPVIYYQTETLLAMLLDMGIGIYRWSPVPPGRVFAIEAQVVFLPLMTKLAPLTQNVRYVPNPSTASSSLPASGPV